MAYVEYETYDHVAEAVKMMDGGKTIYMTKSLIFQGLFNFGIEPKIYIAV